MGRTRRSQSRAVGSRGSFGAGEATISLGQGRGRGGAHRCRLLGSDHDAVATVGEGKAVLPRLAAPNAEGSFLPDQVASTALVGRSERRANGGSWRLDETTAPLTQVISSTRDDTT